MRQEHRVLAGRAIAHLFILSQVVSQADPTVHTTLSEPDAQVIRFLVHDLRTIASELDLLDAEQAASPPPRDAR